MIREAVIDKIVNLRCENGHYHYSPEPFSFVGSECGFKKREGGRCKKKLQFIRTSKKRPPKRKVSRLNRIKRT